MSVSTVKLNGTTLMTVNDTTATAGDVLGKYFYAADGTKTLGTAASQSGSSDGDVIFIDYDGSVVTAKTKAEINAMTSDSDLPENPSHTGLTAQGWNWTVTQLKAQLTAMPDQKVYVGQMYITQSGATEIDIELVDDLALSPYLNLAVNGSVTIDWGDNSETDTVTGTSTSTRIYTQHVYQTTGNYTISITVNSGTFRFYVANNHPILNDKNSSSQYSSRKYSASIKRIRLGGNVNSGSTFTQHYSLASITIPSSITSIGSNAFQNCYSLTRITIPSEITSISDYAFYNCYSLTDIAISSSVTSIGTYTFYSCYSITDIAIPSGVTSISDYALSSCYSLTSVTIPSSVTSIGNYAFSNCYSIASIIIPSGVTSIGNSVFSNCYSVLAYHFKSTTPPTLGTTAFNNIQSDCKIYVPYSEDHSILAAYQSETNWSTYASYMVEEPAP